MSDQENQKTVKNVWKVEKLNKTGNDEQSATYTLDEDLSNEKSKTKRIVMGKGKPVKAPEDMVRFSLWKGAERQSTGSQSAPNTQRRERIRYADTFASSEYNNHQLTTRERTNMSPGVPAAQNAYGGAPRQFTSGNSRPPRSQFGNGDSPNNQQGNELLSSTNLYIRGLPNTTTDDELFDMCKEFGKIVSTKAIMDKQSNQCKGYGFVDFDSHESAKTAVEQLTQKGIQAQMAKVQQEQDPTNLYLANLPINLTDQNLSSLLEEYGPVTSTRILRNAEGISRGVGFARMDSKEKCEEIIRELNGKMLPGWEKNQNHPLLVKLADSGKKKVSKGLPHQMYGPPGHMHMDVYQPQMYMGQPAMDYGRGQYVNGTAYYGNGHAPPAYQPNMYSGSYGSEGVSGLTSQMGGMNISGEAGIPLGQPYYVYSPHQPNNYGPTAYYAGVENNGGYGGNFVAGPSEGEQNGYGNQGVSAAQK